MASSSTDWKRRKTRLHWQGLREALRLTRVTPYGVSLIRSGHSISVDGLRGALRPTRVTPTACRSFDQGIRLQWSGLRGALRLTRVTPDGVSLIRSGHSIAVEWLAMREPSACRRQAEGESNGAPSMIRTCDLLVRSQTLYPAELWARQPLILTTHDKSHKPIKTGLWILSSHW